MFSKKQKIFFICCAFILKAPFFLYAQDTSFVFSGALKEKREEQKRSLIENTIRGNFALPLNASNEEAWEEALNAVNLTKYYDDKVRVRISEAAKYLPKSSADFRKEFLSLVNSDFPYTYHAQVFPLIKKETDLTALAMEINYLLNKPVSAEVKLMKQKVSSLSEKDPHNALLFELDQQMENLSRPAPMPDLSPLFSADFLPGQVVVYSIQRKDRNYPGIAIIRKADGSFMKEDKGQLLFVRQLARSQGNMPGYISMGNTPQGIFRMDGFDHSKSSMIGPSTNIQLTMPFEYKASHFYRDSTLKDSVWWLEQYQQLLPASLKDYHPLYGTYYAGKAGRNEIIAHGTTVDPSFYMNRSYYPFTPSAGCLTTAEEWNEKTGRISSSDQLLLADIVQKAGGPNGYLLVVELNDLHSPVNLQDIFSLIKQ